MTQKLALQWLPCQAPGVIGSALGLVGPVSVYCDWVRQKVGSATSISVWQHVKLCRSVPEIHSHVAGTLSKQASNQPTKHYPVPWASCNSCSRNISNIGLVGHKHRPFSSSKVERRPLKPQSSDALCIHVSDKVNTKPLFIHTDLNTGPDQVSRRGGGFRRGSRGPHRPPGGVKGLFFCFVSFREGTCIG